MAEKFWVFSDPYCFVGFFTQLLFILTPVAFIYQLKKGYLLHERVSIFALLSLYCNAFIYFFTSLQKKQKGADIDPLDYANLTGSYLGLVYLIFYLYLVHIKKNKLYGILYLVILVVGSVGVWLIIFFTVEKDNIADKIFNWLGVIFNVTEYFPMGFNIIYLIKNKISEKYTLFGAFFGFLNCVAWLCWAIYSVAVNHDDLEHSIVANSLGICLQICQVTLFFIFKRDDQDDTDNIEETTRNISDGDIDVGNSKEDIKEPEYMDDYI